MNNKVLVTGVFDILHKEHLIFLNKAKSLGDYLVVGIESNLRVAQMKGKDRPINSQDVRVLNIEKLKIADEVFILPEEFSKPEHHKELIKKIKPKILAVSSHTKHFSKKQAILHDLGGEVVVVHKHNPAVSSTHLLNNT
jgi:cytidyltransferase-like protein